MTQNLCFFYSTFDSPQVARTLIKQALKLHYITCAHIYPQGESFYLWKKQICHEKEWVVLFKTPHEKRDDFRAWLLENHPYETPCLLEFHPHDATGGRYSQWMRDELELT